MRLTSAAVLLALVPAALLAQTSPPAREVVVTGRRLADTEAALTTCLARHCPPGEDIDASLAHAENLFVAARYQDARDVVRRSLGRNKRFAKTLPIPVAELWRAQSRVAAHVGEADEYRVAAVESLGVLRAGLPADDPRILEQQLEVADSLAHLGRVDEAMGTFATVARRAEALHQPRWAGLALLRRAMLYTALSATDYSYRPLARQEIAHLAKSSDPALASFRQAADILTAQLSIGAGDRDGIARLIAAAHVSATDRPALLYAPPIDEGSNLRAFRSGDVIDKMATEEDTGQWADVSFWVKPDGTVADADVLRGSPTLDRTWLGPVLASIGGRRYAPLKLDKSDPGVLRIERYTRTAHLVAISGSRIRAREAYPRIEMLDLSDDSRAAATVPAPAAMPPGTG